MKIYKVIQLFGLLLSDSWISVLYENLKVHSLPSLNIPLTMTFLVSSMPGLWLLVVWFLLLFCVFMCSCMRSPKVNVRFLPQSFPTYFWNSVSHQTSDLARPSWSMSIKTPHANPLAPGLQPSYCEFHGFHEHWESELRSSCSHNKHCVH